MVNCCAFKCSNRSEKKEEGITFHRFPADAERRSVWIKNIGIQNWSPSQYDRLCSVHFEEKWFYVTKLTRRLLRKAIPTIFTSLSAYLQAKSILPIMVMCWAYGCNHYSDRGAVCKFFRFPLNEKERNRWKRLLRRDTEPGPGAYVCSCHFRDGQRKNGPELFDFNAEKRSSLAFPEAEMKTKRRKTVISSTSREPMPSTSAATIELAVPLPSSSKDDDLPSTESGGSTVGENYFSVISTGSMMSLVCRHCSFETKWKFAIEEHTKQHSNIGLEKSYSCSALLNKHKCVQCSFKSITLEKIKQHNIAQHGYTLVKNKSNTDINSGKTSKHLKHNKLLNRNLQGRSTKSLNCNDCEYKTKGSSFLYAHKRSKYLVNKQINWLKCKCSYCDYISNTKENLKAHIYHRHTPDEQIDWFKCSDCDYKGKTKKALKTHKLVQHTADEQIERFKCSDCDFQAKRSTQLNSHKLHRHAPDEQIKWFKCSDCDFQTKHRSNLKIHKLHRHAPDEQTKWFKCSDCDYQTKRRSNLKTHKLHHHAPDEQIKWFKCSDCDYQTKQRSHLKEHKLHRHAPDEQIEWFKCNDCDFQTKHRSNLKRHKLHRHAPDEQIEWFKCSDCDYQTKQKSHLKEHKLHRHAPDEQIKWFKCSDCDFQTKHRSNLKIHKLHRHTPDEQIEWFKCSDCDYRTKQRSHLKEHKLHRHAPDEQMEWFKCSDCDYKGKTRSTLKAHQLGPHAPDEKIECIFKSKMENTLKQIKKEHAYCK